MENLASTKVGKIVAQNFRTSTVLTARGIDFCCNGGITLEEACKNKGQELEEVIKELEISFTQRDAFDFQSLTSTQLIKHIVSSHHQYVSSTIPPLNAYLEKLCRVYGDRYPQLFEIQALFSVASEALLFHMQKEERVLFPYVEEMEAAKNRGEQPRQAMFGDIENPIHMMEEEHSTEGDRFHKIAKLTDNYTCPPDGCQTFRVTYALLKEFEEDLHKHIHLENNILFQKSRALYDSFHF